MWDFLMFMKEARNFTFTLVHETDYIWGECYGADNCTGMVGMVNRKEVDFAIGRLSVYFREQVLGWEKFDVQIVSL